MGLVLRGRTQKRVISNLLTAIAMLHGASVLVQCGESTPTLTAHGDLFAVWKNVRLRGLDIVDIIVDTDENSGAAVLMVRPENATSIVAEFLAEGEAPCADFAWKVLFECEARHEEHAPVSGDEVREDFPSDPRISKAASGKVTVAIVREPSLDCQHGEAETRMQYTTSVAVSPVPNFFGSKTPSLSILHISADSDNVILRLLAVSNGALSEASNVYVKVNSTIYDVRALMECLEAAGIEALKFARLYALSGLIIKLAVLSLVQSRCCRRS